MSLIQVTDIKDRKIYFTHEGVTYVMSGKQFSEFADLHRVHAIEVLNDVDATYFHFNDNQIEAIYATGSLDKIHIPERKQCSEDLRDILDGYLIDSLGSEFDDEDISLINTIVSKRNLHIYRGQAMSTSDLKVGNIIKMGDVSSWSTSRDVALTFADCEVQYIVDCNVEDEVVVLFELEGEVDSFIPTDYCSKEIYLNYAIEEEVGLLQKSVMIESIELDPDMVYKDKTVLYKVRVRLVSADDIKGW